MCWSCASHGQSVYCCKNLVIRVFIISGVGVSLSALSRGGAPGESLASRVSAVRSRHSGLRTRASPGPPQVRYAVGSRVFDFRCSVRGLPRPGSPRSRPAISIPMDSEESLARAPGPDWLRSLGCTTVARPSYHTWTCTHFSNSNRTQFGGQRKCWMKPVGTSS